MTTNLRKSYNDLYKNKWKSKASIPYKSVALYQEVFSVLSTYVKKNNPKLLDVACGVGGFLMEAKGENFEIFGIDISDEAVAIAREKTGAKITRASAEKMRYRANSFDAITCIGSLEHFTNPEKVLKEMNRVLRSQGVCLLHVPNLMFAGHIYMTLRDGSMPSEDGQYFSEEYRTYQGWKDLIESNGFKVVKCNTYNDMSGSERVGPVIKFLWQNLLRYFVPFHLSYTFNFYCKKRASRKT